MPARPIWMKLRRLIPSHFRQRVEGETDSEHLFYVLLGRAEDGRPGADGLAAVVRDVAAIGR